MNFTQKETRDFFEELLRSWPVSSPETTGLRTTLFIPFLSLETALKTCEKLQLPIQVGAQNVHFEKSGAFTGEISGGMLKEIQIQNALVGHSERRQYFGETNESVFKRTQGLLQQDFEVLLCVGETRAQREAGETEAVLMEQLSKGMPGVHPRLRIAYEPVWAIGTGLTATPEQAEEAHAMIRKYLAKNLGEAAAQSTPLLYGGSVTPENLESLLACPNVDGALVGGASLKPAGFAKMAQISLKALSI